MKEKFRQLIRTYAQSHPMAEVTDIMKLIYQSSFGSGHMVGEDASLSRLLEEAADAPADQPLFEELCGDFWRINLSALSVISPQLLNRMFAVSGAVIPPGAQESFDEKIKWLQELASCEKSLSFTESDIQNEWEKYKASGYAPVHHSEQFKGFYPAHYRVVRKEFCQYLPAFAAVERLMAEKERVTAAIDGNAAAGKSTLAQVLASVFPSQIIHADDFFLPAELRTPARMAEIGGNFHYERWEEEICRPLQSGREFSYGIFDCSVMEITRREMVPPKPLLILEGSYTLHPRLQAYYDLKIFLGLDEETQRERILRRNGPQMLKRFTGEWIPMENAYFEMFQIPSAAELCFGTAQENFDPAGKI